MWVEKAPTMFRRCASSRRACLLRLCHSARKQRTWITPTTPMIHGEWSRSHCMGEGQGNWKRWGGKGCEEGRDAGSRALSGGPDVRDVKSRIAILTFQTAK